MRIGCIYTVERGASPEKPLLFAMDIPFGISTIATLLESSGHDVDLFVFSQNSPFEQRLENYINASRPKLLCFTAVSTQFAFVRRLVRLVKSIDPSVFVVLGGHHASLASEEAIITEGVDAICVGEGDASAVSLAEKIENGQSVTNIPSLWIKQSNGRLEKNSTSPFQQKLDEVPHINRKMWEPWIKEPHKYPSVLLGRGCPFRCTYCSNHAMQQLSTGRFTRFRSPKNIVDEIGQICTTYPTVDSIYLEVETISHQAQASPLFVELESFNGTRDEKICFGLNFTVTSDFISKEERCREFLEILNRANVVYLNIGLESGSEKLRREVLRRPKYSNEEFLQFSRLAKEYGINLDFYVLIGVPGETLEDYKETVTLVREAQPKMVFLSIFYPYLGTDLCKIAFEQGLLSKDDLDPTAERARAALNLPGFSKSRIRLEYVLFWFRAFRGYWPVRRILLQTGKGIINGSPRLWALYQVCKEKSRVFKFFRRLQNLNGGGNKDSDPMHRPAQIEFTYMD